MFCWWQRGQGEETETRDTQAVGETGLANWLDVRAKLEAQVKADSPVLSWVPGTEETSGKEGEVAIDQSRQLGTGEVHQPQCCSVLITMLCAGS